MITIDDKKHPKGLKGWLLLRKMAKCHQDLIEYGLSFLELKPSFKALDIGCGPGYTIKRYLDSISSGYVYGVDISDIAVKMTKRRNKKAIKAQRCTIYNTNFMDLELKSESIDIISAFCNVKLWDNLEAALALIYSLLKPKGCFLICDYGRYNVLEMINLIKYMGFREVVNHRSSEGYNVILAKK